jgi:hypothetical protein
MSSRTFAIKAEVRDPKAAAFTFGEQKTMYGGRQIAAGDLIFIFASENEGGPGLIASGTVTAVEATPREPGVARQTPRVSIAVRRTALAKQRLGEASSSRSATGTTVGPRPSSTSSSTARPRTRSRASPTKRPHSSAVSSSGGERLGLPHLHRRRRPRSRAGVAHRRRARNRAPARMPGALRWRVLPRARRQPARRGLACVPIETSTRAPHDSTMLKTLPLLVCLDPASSVASSSRSPLS